MPSYCHLTYPSTCNDLLFSYTSLLKMAFSQSLIDFFTLSILNHYDLPEFDYPVEITPERCRPTMHCLICGIISLKLSFTWAALDAIG